MLVVGFGASWTALTSPSHHTQTAQTREELELKEYTLLPPPICVHWK